MKPGSTTVHDAIDGLCCPLCRGPFQWREESLVCSDCSRVYPVRAGIPCLLDTGAANTRLDQQAYDQHHDIDDECRETVGQMWHMVFNEYGVGGGDVLEVGCGTGQLTQALLKCDRVRRVYATDISPEFLEITRAHVGESPHVRFYACDANRLPFCDNTLDLVVGHSVLHHLLDYPAVLRQAAQLLRPGGCAIFFEPVLQGKIMVAFLASLMLRIHGKTGYGRLSPEDCDKLTVMIRHITKHREFGQDRAKLAKMEDKYIFDAHELLALARDCGFAESSYRNNPTQDAQFRYNLSQHLRMQGIDEDKLADFRFLLNAAKEMLIDMLPNDRYTPMGFFILRK